MQHFIQAAIRKFAYLLVGFLFASALSYCSIAEAGTFPSPKTYTSAFGSANYIYNERYAAVEAFVKAHSLANNWGYKSIIMRPENGGSNTSCRYTDKNNVERGDFTCAIGRQICPVGTTSNGVYPNQVCTDTCVSPQYFQTTSNTCVSPTVCDSLAGAQTSYFSNVASGSSCYEGCTVYVDSGSCGFNQEGVQGCFYNGTYSKETCVSTNEPEPINDPAYDCIKAGKSYGEVNGVVVCAPIGTPNTQPTTTVKNSATNTTAPNGIKTEQKKSTTVNPDGTVTRDTTTKTINADGSEVVVVEKLFTDKDNFCELNPNAKECRLANEQKNSCESDPNSPSCKHYCDIPANSKKLACIEQGDDLTETKADLDTMAVNFNIAPRSGIPSMAGCPVPQQVSIGQVTIPISYAWICQYAEAFRYLVLIFSWIGAAYIVYQASVKD